MKPNAKLSPIVKVGLIFFSVVLVFLICVAWFNPQDNTNGGEFNSVDKVNLLWFIGTFLGIFIISYVQKKLIPWGLKRPVLINNLRKIERVYKIILYFILAGEVLVIVFFPVGLLIIIGMCNALFYLSFGHVYWLCFSISLLMVLVGVFAGDSNTRGFSRYWLGLYILIFIALLSTVNNPPEITCIFH